MIFAYTNQGQHLTAEIALSIHDDEPVLIPLYRECQEEWNKRAKSNRKQKQSKESVSLN
jgi:hypothetical protein